MSAFKKLCLVTALFSSSFALADGTLRLLSFNVGGAAFKFEGIKLVPSCVEHKLCKPEIAAEVRAHISALAPDVIFLQETQGLGQLLGQEAGGPVLPPGYAADCESGHAGPLEVCIAWRVDRAARTARDCRTFFLKNGKGSSLRCDLSVDGTEIQFVSNHPPVFVSHGRHEVNAQIWNSLIEPGKPAVVAGDFNTSDCTQGEPCELPYPPEFGTLYGIQAKGYGRWGASETFFGHAHQDGSLESHITSRAGLRLDHIFTNFGERAPDLTPCGEHSCVGGKDKGYDWAPSAWPLDSILGIEIDHLPVASALRF